jgi:histone-lysine N-methyltransferase SETD3
LNYGFALEDNEDNEYKITLFIDKNIKNFSLKKDIYDPQNLLFLGFLRVLCSEGIISVRARTIENEKRCLNKIMEKFLDILSKYSTSVEEDKELLKNPNLSFNIRNCIIMRMGEKEILEYFISFSKYVLNYLNKIPNKQPNIIFDKFIQENYKQFQL